MTYEKKRIIQGTNSGDLQKQSEGRLKIVEILKKRYASKHKQKGERLQF